MKLYKRMISFLLAMAIFLGVSPYSFAGEVETHTHEESVELPISAETENEWEGKTISILGDSISTYAGVSNNTSYNSTIGKNAIYYTEGKLNVYRKDTWWQKTIDALDLELLVNNSWSGSCVLHKRSNTVGAYIDRCVQLHNDPTGETPDIIAVFLGTNDFSYYQSTLGTADIDYDALIVDNGDGTYTYSTPTTTCEAYAIMLHKMKLRYPDAEIYCMNMLARREPVYSGSDVGQPTAFNAELAKIIASFGVTLVDLENCGITKEPIVFDLYIGDKRVHPGPDGMTLMSKALISAMTGKDTTLHSVFYDLQNVTADTNANVTIAGESFTVALTSSAESNGMKVSVMMGNEDITSSAYQNGKITIEKVTGDIKITAKAEKLPSNYCWEFDGKTLVSVGDVNNDLTKLGGTVENGVLKNTYYRMEVPVDLYANRPWMMEFRAGGAWSGMLFSSLKTSSAEGNTYLFKTTSDSGLIAFGERKGTQYYNYGVPLTSLGVDTTQMHTYRLENKIETNGTNMVYLFVDGVSYGAMNHYFIAGTDDQGKTVDWVSGKDFSFSYIGASSHALNNCAMEYIKVWENGHAHDYESIVTAPTCTEKGYTTYTCDCGDSYVDDYVKSIGHTYDNYTCSICGFIMWEQGTIASIDGTNNNTSTRYRTSDYLLISDYVGVGINTGYTMTNFVYDKNYNYLGTSSWLGSGIPFTTEELQEKYPSGVYFRVVFRADNQRRLTEEDLVFSGVKFYLPGEEMPKPSLEFDFEDMCNIGIWQDGAIWDGKLFVLNAAGSGAVFDVKNGNKLSSFKLDKKDILKPHANSVCFGSKYYAEGDKYPLFYVNIYNNYASAADRLEGTCCVYRVTEEDGKFKTELVQVIRIGFTEDLTLWKSKENNGDVRPYGNFVVDTDNDLLYAFVMRDANKTTRYFGFDIPGVTEGTYNETYDCNMVILETEDIKIQFDSEHYKYLQGCCYSNGMIMYMGDFGGEAPLYVVDLKSQKVTDVFYLGYAGLRAEPEVLSVDPDDGTIYYAAADGMLRKLTLDNIHFHDYQTIAATPTCTTQGYTTYTCACGDTYIDNYIDAKGHSFTHYVSDNNATLESDGTKTAKCDHCDATDTIIDVGSKLEYIRGDMNGDEELNSADAIYLLRHVIMQNMYPIDQSADVNGDGTISSADAIYLLRHVIMPDLYPLAK